MSESSQAVLPYKIACLCYLYNETGELLLLHRALPPNRHLYSPIGGKLHTEEGESPMDCALREIEEEVGLTLTRDDIRLAGIVSETAYNNETHWLMFLYKVTHPVVVERTKFREGTLEWHDVESVHELPLPETDRVVINPLLEKYADEFFHVHIDCSGGEIAWWLEHPKG